MSIDVDGDVEVGQRQLTDVEVRLRTLIQAVKGVRGALLASSDGRPVGSALAEGQDERSTAAIIASSLALGDRLAELTGRGQLQEIVVRSHSGYVVLYSVGPRGVLTVFTDSAINLALLHLKARDVIGHFEGVVERFLHE